MRSILLALALLGCEKPPMHETPTNTDRGVAPRAKATVTLTSVTFADDCGGIAPAQEPAAPSDAPAGTPAKPARNAPGAVAARRRCEQTSMQLAVVGIADTDVRIKSVEVFDEAGTSIGTLVASRPTRWVDAKSAYETWDEKVSAGKTTRVSYALSQPGFVNRYDSHDRTYTVKVVAAVGGVEQSLQTTTMVVAQPAPVPT